MKYIKGEEIFSLFEGISVVIPSFFQKVTALKNVLDTPQSVPLPTVVDQMSKLMWAWTSRTVRLSPCQCK